MTARELIAWSTLHERRSRAGRWWTLPGVLAVVAGAALAGWVAWRAESGFATASHAWLAATVVAFAIGFLRVPFHLYWRADAALLAQLPIEGGPLFDAALLRCLRAAAATTLAVLIAAIPLARESLELAARHAAVAAALGLAAGMFMPAVATWAAMIVAVGQRDQRVQKMKAAAGIADAPGPPSTALLGALPGFAATFVIVGVLVLHRWLLGGVGAAPAPIVLGAIAGVSVVAILGARSAAQRTMGTILRDISALDRQRLATLEIKPPTGIERLIGKLVGEAALPYKKDARLVRRRYPMAFALGALAFLVLGIVGVAQPDDPGPWMTATFSAAAVYGMALAGRLARPPIELPRLSSTLPITHAARWRAKHAWIAGWWTIFIAAPGLFAALRQPDPVPGLAILGGATLAVAIASKLAAVR